MKVLIVEDEFRAAERLIQLLKNISEDIEVIDRFDTISKTVKYFKNGPVPDILFLDIQLADGISFDIFQQVEVPCPVVFTTAYDKYALRAFEVNSIDYLLKPIKSEELQRALDKYANLKSKDPVKLSPEILQGAMELVMGKQYKSRFVIKVGEHLKAIKTEDISCFYSFEKATFIATGDNRKYITDFSLEKIEEMLNPDDFFRINRKYIINREAITDIVSYTNSRLRIITSSVQNMEMIVSREKVVDFKSWLET